MVANSAGSPLVSSPPPRSAPSQSPRGKRISAVAIRVQGSGDSKAEPERKAVRGLQWDHAVAEKFDNFASRRAVGGAGGAADTGVLGKEGVLSNALMKRRQRMSQESVRKYETSVAEKYDKEYRVPSSLRMAANALSPSHVAAKDKFLEILETYSKAVTHNVVAGFLADLEEDLQQVFMDRMEAALRPLSTLDSKMHPKFLNTLRPGKGKTVDIQLREHLSARDFLSILPNELWLKIFGYLDIRSLGRLATVSVRASKLALDPSLWESIDLVRYSKTVKSTGGVLRTIADHFPRLLSINLTQCGHINDGDVITLVERCRYLKEIKLSGNALVGDPSLKAIGVYLSDLESIELSSYPTSSEFWAHALQDGNEELKKLHVIQQKSPFTSSGLSLMLSRTIKLKRLDLTYRECVTDMVSTALSNYCTEVRVLSLSNCSQIKDMSLQSLALGCHQLEELNISSCPLLTDIGFRSLTNKCHMLKKLDVSMCTNGVTERTAYALADKCHQLTHLRMRHCKKLTNGGVRHIMRQLSNLEELDLSGCSEVGDAGISDIEYRCKSLHTLMLGGTGISNKAITSICAGQRPSLKKLGLRGCKLVTSAAMNTLTVGAASLEMLDIAGATEIGASGKMIVLTRLPNCAVIDEVHRLAIPDGK